MIQKFTCKGQGAKSNWWAWRSFFLERGQKDTYSCLLRPKSKLKLGEVLYSDDGNNEALFKVTSLEPPFCFFASTISIRCNS